MKMDTQSRKIDSFNSGEVHQMQIHDTRKILRVITNEFYSDKIGSAIREIYSNAHDAHTEAGIDLPVKVSLPSQLDPNFSIRDFGDGLSKEFMLTKYTAAGYSSKDESNNLVGGWGWGRLSALSCTDNYTVTSYQQGTKCIYTVYLDAEGTPAINFVFEGDTKEPDGLMVSWPVAIKDYVEYRNKAQDFFRFLEEDVDCTGIEKAVPDVHKENMKLYSNMSEPGKAYVKMGCVCYPIPESVVREALNRNNLGYWGLSYGVSVVFDIPIGSVDVTVSREGVSWNEKSKTFVVGYIRNVVRKAENSFEGELQNFKYQYDAAKFLNSILKFKEIFDGVKGLKYKNINDPHILNIAGGTTVGRIGAYDKSLMNPKCKKECHTLVNSGFPVLNISLLESEKIFLARAYSDKDKGIKKDTYVPKRVSSSDVKGKILIVFVDSQKAEQGFLKRIREACGNTNLVKYVSDLPELSKVARSSSSQDVKMRNSVQILQQEESSDFFAGGGYYFLTNKKSLEYNDKEVYEVFRLFNFLKNYKLFKSVNIASVPASYEKALKKSGKWERISKKEDLKKILQDKSEAEKVVETAIPVATDQMRFISSIIIEKGLEVKDKLLEDIFEKINRYKGRTYSHIRNLEYIKDIFEIKDDREYKVDFSRVMEYPMSEVMLGWIGHWPGDKEKEKVKDFVDYLNMYYETKLKGEN